MHRALEAIRETVQGTEFENELWLVGGALRDELLGREQQNDYDIVLQGSASDLARLLHERGVSQITPVTYERFGTAMVIVEGVNIELVTARRESYDEESRKPHVEPATLEEDARRRDFTVNTLMRNVSTGELHDPLQAGLADLEGRVLRTPLDPVATFHDDPLRMLRAVRFRWQLGFNPAPGLYEGVRECAERLAIISGERIRDELNKMLLRPTAPDALRDLMDLGLMHVFAPELESMVGVEQGNYHHLDVWEHSLLVVRNTAPGDLVATLGALLHDIGKPATRTVDEEGRTRFFGHESVGEKLTRELLRRLRYPGETIDKVAILVRNHMRLGSSPTFSESAARRLWRDLGPLVPKLLTLVEADVKSLKPGVKAMDLEPIRAQLLEVRLKTPPERLESPLSGEEIMEIAGLEPGPGVGRLKQMLLDKVLDGDLAPGDKDAARKLLAKAVQHPGQ